MTTLLLDRGLLPLVVTPVWATPVRWLASTVNRYPPTLLDRTQRVW